MRRPPVESHPRHVSVAEEEEPETVAIRHVDEHLVKKGADVEGSRVEGISKVSQRLLDRHELVADADEVAVEAGSVGVGPRVHAEAALVFLGHDVNRQRPNGPICLGGVLVVFDLFDRAFLKELFHFEEHFFFLLGEF